MEGRGGGWSVGWMEEGVDGVMSKRIDYGIIDG